MPADLKIPQLGESITEAEILLWRCADGDVVAVDEIVVELETDKTTVELPSPAAGTLRILKPQGALVAVGDVIGRIEEASAAKPAGAKAAKSQAAAAPSSAAAPVQAAPAPAAATVPSAAAAPAPAATSAGSARLGPAARRAAEEQNVDPRVIEGTGPGGRATKSDVAAAAARQAAPLPQAPAASAPAIQKAPAPSAPRSAEDVEERTRMSRLRRTIADRLVAAQHTAAILTTFNEIDMSAAMELRARHKERFEKTHGVSLGLMSIFARACLLALRDVPVVGAHLDGDEIVTSRRVHLGIAASTDRGLVVPVVRNADLMSMADIEREIGRLAGLARDGKLGVEDLSGGTFTLSNGGVFGSLLSTPILNPPQSGILGMHKIEKRPVVVADQIVIRPMMYVALSYDHRLVDGREAVTFLVRVKERVEDPARLLLEV
ncbi:MAG TPA: 2-oxoglutarate dehydrogenase complex dihydrolipoyllysine-residue succinyltransferase [Candidatus Limnocylindrales bacterium]|nr:2-oxoglutarate dehydrogenase complex dihydrolipoyllysine-residue succinyltransferase [Candidatus Limnocylindrales bacterium]